MHIFFDQLFKASEDVRDYYPTSTVEWFSTQVLSKSIKVNLICHTIHWIVSTLWYLMENMDNFEARTERVNFGLFWLNSDFT